ncbi:MAG: transporter [Betaproteobacteria bacterium RIFCSPLOWO2_12_FULL_63_13]|nr:MAG: transporter [Betaproteobacteria bacterium RIFCSPLOWO2_02_FULL_63_19]OGA54066.1 MAG: transporter [Betaproteobacteria bacterium RIFCSPLOWO2_12_FULL_63_13]
MRWRITSLLLNVAHAIDHLMLLVFATAVSAIATDFGIGRWEDLMPYTTVAFLLFGIGSLPAGRLGDLWGRRAMMLVFFFGMGASTMLIALTQNAWQLAFALGLMGAFSSIYHPVGIPMLLRHARTPGITIGINGMAGNLGIAAAAILTGFLIQYADWRAAFVVPGLVSIACGLLFMKVAPPEHGAPGKQAVRQIELPTATRNRVFLVMTTLAITSSIVFNFTTNGNGELLKARLPILVQQPALLGTLLAVVYALSSVSQLAVGRLIDRFPIRNVMLGIYAFQGPVFLLAAYSQGWTLYAAMVFFMMLVFGAIPFTDAIVARFVDDSIRSRVSGMRLAVSFGMSSMVVWALGPAVKAAGFGFSLLVLGAVALCSLLVTWKLPDEQNIRRASELHPPQARASI